MDAKKIVCPVGWELLKEGYLYASCWDNSKQHVCLVISYSDLSFVVVLGTSLHQSPFKESHYTRQPLFATPLGIYFSYKRPILKDGPYWPLHFFPFIVTAPRLFFNIFVFISTQWRLSFINLSGLFRALLGGLLDVRPQEVDGVIKAVIRFFTRKLSGYFSMTSNTM